MANDLQKILEWKVIEDMENLLFCAERAIPPHPRVLQTGKDILEGMVAAYYKKYPRPKAPEPDVSPIEVEKDADVQDSG